MKKMQMARLLAYVTGMVNQELLLQNEYLVAENRILSSHLPARVPLTDPQRVTLAEIGKRLGRQALQAIASVARPDTILAWYRKVIACQFDGSKHRAYPGRPLVGQEITELIVRMARENLGWGYDRIAEALQNLGYSVSDQTIGNILHLETRRVTLAGITPHPTEEWMVQMARRVVDPIDGALLPVRFVWPDRDTKFCAAWQDTLRSAGVRPLTLPARSPNLNSFAERWVRTIKSECWSKLIWCGEASLRRALSEFLKHYHQERSHQGKQNLLLFPAHAFPISHQQATVTGHERLGGLLKFYQRAA